MGAKGAGHGEGEVEDEAEEDAEDATVGRGKGCIFLYLLYYLK